MLSPDKNPSNHHPGDTVDVRLARRWGVQPKSAHWAIYHGERGVRAKALDIIRELGPVKGRQWLAPLMGELARMESEVALQEQIELDAAQNVAMGAYLNDNDGDKSDTRRTLILALEKEASADMALASQLRAEEEAER